MALGKKTGGRTKGTLNKRTEETRDVLKKLGFNPVRRAVKLAETTEDDAIKAQMIKALLKHWSPELKAVEVNAQVTHWTPELIATLSDTQLQMFMATFHQTPGLSVVDEEQTWPLPLPEP